MSLTIVTQELGFLLLFGLVIILAIGHRLPRGERSGKAASGLASLLRPLGNDWHSPSQLPKISAWQATRKLWNGTTYEQLLRDGHSQHGSVFAVEDPFLSRRIVLTDPVALKHIQVRHAANYPKSIRARQVLRFQLGDGLILHDGEERRK